MRQDANVPGEPGPWRRLRATARNAGPAGNNRLTTSIGLVLFALLGVEALTTLRLRSYLPVHIFLGLLLLPTIGLKLASTGWRFMRYYTRSVPYPHEGPPKLLLRLLAPVLVVSTLALFGTGVALIVVGHGNGWLRSLHGISFGVWGVVMIVHARAYLTRTVRTGTEDWRPGTGEAVAGMRARRALLGAALLAGLIVAGATYPAQRTWLSHRHDHRFGDRPDHPRG